LSQVALFQKFIRSLNINLNINMQKELIISFDDLWEGNDRWIEFEKLHAEFPDLKITFFVITGKCSNDFLRKIKQPWIQLVFHSFEHSGNWLHWTVEETKQWLLKFQEFRFEKGFKAPAYKWKEAHIKACDELGFWICSGSTVPVKAKRYWLTSPYEGLTEYKDREYNEYYDHIQRKDFLSRLEELKKFLKKTKPIYKFISEKVINNINMKYEQQNITYYWK